MEIQEIVVYGLFALAIGYFAYRFYAKNLKKKPAGNAGVKSCNTGDCGCD